jgi:signal transduction histidine kinase
MSMPEPTIILPVLAAAIAAFLLFMAGTRARSARLIAGAAARERRRLARELHDGLAQELAFISMQARHAAQNGSDETLDEIADAADRALNESRGLITRLRSSGDELAMEIAGTAEALAERHGATLSLDVASDFRADPETGRHLLRILAEALSNSFVHGRARNVAVELSQARLKVADDGIGFEAEANRPSEHFGLMSMRERAREIGAELVLRSHPGAGTQVEVVLP